MFVQAEVDRLSPQALKKLQKGLPVRVKMGSGMMVTLPIEEAKRLAKVGLKGKGIMLKYSPEHMKASARFGMGAVSEELKQNAADNAINLMTASTNRGIKGINGNGMNHHKHMSHHGMGAVSDQLKQNAADNAINLMTASTNRGIKGINGNGAVSKKLKEAAAQNLINIMTASTDRGIKGIKGNGMSHHKHMGHHHMVHHHMENEHHHMGHHHMGHHHKGGIISAPTTPRTNPTNYLGPAGSGVRRHMENEHHHMGHHHMGHHHMGHHHMGHHHEHMGDGIKRRGRPRKHFGPVDSVKHHKGKGISGANKFDKYTGKIGDVLGLNSKAAQDAKKQIVNAAGDAGSTYIISQVPGSQFASPSPNYSQPPQYSAPPPMAPMPSAPSRAQAPKMPKAPKTPASSASAPETFDPNNYSSNIDSYVLPSGKLYASGMKKNRVKRVMSEKQMAALKKGREALRMKLNQMSGTSLYNSGYTSANS